MLTIKNYHADNGVFSHSSFVNDIHHQQQTISFCGVGSHHQKGIAEKKFWYLTEL